VELGHERVSRVMPRDRGGGRRAVTRPNHGARRAEGGSPAVGGSREGEELLRVGDLLCQGIGSVALALPSEGSLPQAGLPRCVLGLGSGEGIGEGGRRTRHGERHGWGCRKGVGAGPCACCPLCLSA